MRILFYVFFPSGGIGKYSHELASQLALSPELDVEMACLPEFQWHREGNYRAWPHLQSIGSLNPLIRKGRFLSAQFVNPRRLAKRARETGADIMHLCNLNHLSYPFWERAIPPGAKIVTSVHDVRRGATILNRKWEELQLRRIYRRCDALFVHSSGQSDDLRDFAGIDERKIHIVPHGPHRYAAAPHQTIDELRAGYGLPADRPVGLFFGFIRPDKNLDRMILGMKRATRPFHLLVAGNTSPRFSSHLADVQSLVKELGLEDSVTFMNRYIPDEEVPALFALADWVAVPYEEAFSSQSGVLNVATFYRRPLLATPTPSFAETLSKADVGVICRGFDPADIGLGLDELNSRRGKPYPYEFDRYLEEFSWERNAEITLQVYRDICKAPIAAKRKAESDSEARREASLNL